MKLFKITQKTTNSHEAVARSTRAVASTLKNYKNHSSSQKKQKSTAPPKCTIDTGMAQHLHRIVETDHTVGAVAVAGVVQRPK